MRVQFIHGLESSPQSRKAVNLAEHFEALTPAMDTENFDACVDIQSRSLQSFEPDLIVGSSFGGAVALELLQRGDWCGPTLLLAQAALKRGQECRLPEGVPIWIVHGTGDALIDIEDSRQLARAGSPEHVRLIEVEDNHELRASVLGGQLIEWVRELWKFAEGLR